MPELRAVLHSEHRSAAPGGARQSSRVADLLRRRAQGLGGSVQRFGYATQLAGEYGVTRATLRAAIRELEREGVIRIARGRQGGIYAAAAPRAEAARRLSDYLTVEDAPISGVAGQAMQLYRIAARWAAERHRRRSRRAKAALARARALMQSSPNLDGWCEMRTAFVSGAENRALDFLYGAYQGAYRDALAAELHLGNRETERAQDLWDEESRLFDAVATGNQAAADKAALACVNLEAKYVTESLAKGMLARTLMPETLFHLSSMAPRSGNKLAHQTMRALHANIRRSAAVVGDRLGSVATLAAHYGVSDDVMRDALLLAEKQQLVVLRRGRAGGVFVAVPDHARAVDDAAGYLVANADRREIEALLIETREQPKKADGENLTGNILKAALQKYDTLRVKSHVR